MSHITISHAQASGSTQSSEGTSEMTFVLVDACRDLLTLLWTKLGLVPSSGGQSCRD
jgi:hypothetical protein